MKKQELKTYAFSGGNYKNDCGLYLALSKIDSNARLYPKGASIKLGSKEAAIEMQHTLAKLPEIDFPVRVFELKD